MLIIILLLGLPMLTTAICYFIIFYSPTGNQNNNFSIPRGDQYECNKHVMFDLIKRFHDISFEEVHIKSFDGLNLAGQYHETAPGAPLAICMHGYRGTPARDFCGGSKLAIENGQNLLVIQQRACCSSDGHTISFGINEEKDLIEWINWANERFGQDTKILLYGISMGAYTVLLASGDPDLPNNVQGIIADSPYNSPKEIICDVGAKMGLPMKLLYPFVKISARVFGGFKLQDLKASDSVKSSNIPIMIIHGEDDRFVPCEMSKPISDANNDLVARHTFPGAGHGLSFMVDYPRYKKLVSDFSSKI